MKAKTLEKSTNVSFSYNNLFRLYIFYIYPGLKYRAQKCVNCEWMTITECDEYWI